MFPEAMDSLSILQAITEAWSHRRDSSTYLTGIKRGSRICDILFSTIAQQRMFIRNDPSIDPAVRRIVDAQARTSLGWLAANRGVSEEAVEAHDKLLEKGFVIPHADTDELEIRGRLSTKKGTVMAGFKAMTEKSERHNCACCSGQVLPNTTRITLSLDKNDGYSDHHHYHIPCFDVSVLPRFDISTLGMTTMRLG